MEAGIRNRQKKGPGRKFAAAVQRKRRTRILLAVIFLAAEFAFLLGKGMGEQGDALQTDIAARVLRFHVLGASNSARDQELKLKVRDAIGLFLKSKLKKTENRDEAELLVKDAIPDIIRVARETLEQNGCSYPVSAGLKEESFPAKSYGRYTFPAGRYRALQVVIGAGRGHNWWCVLYPNMCFSGSMYSVQDEEAGERLREVLSPEEYDEVLRKHSYRLRFRLLELLGL